ncbi:MAG TPA: flagellar hook-length control protein FliK, partial [Pyrinomonadaceae bacterium]
MKIPPANPLASRPAPETNRALNRRGQAPADAPRADETAGEFEGSAATERDFASVLDEVVARPERREEEPSDGDRRVSRDAERAEHDGSAKRREEREGGSNQAGADGRGGGFDTRAGLREVSAAGETSSARAILHVADLERIVSAVRAQVADGGRQAVTIELRRSVLEGLKVTLSTDAGGRVTAEFVAGSERVRSQLDARAGELAELLRGRGVNLASLRTSVDSGGGAQ